MKILKQISLCKCTVIVTDPELQRSVARVPFTGIELNSSAFTWCLI